MHKNTVKQYQRTVSTARTRLLCAQYIIQKKNVMPKLIRLFTFFNITTTVVEILVGFLIKKYWFLKINVVDVYIFILSIFHAFITFSTEECIQQYRTNVVLSALNK
jgi:hypothetical protein